MSGPRSVCGRTCSTPPDSRSLRCSALRWMVTGVPYAGALGARGAAGDGHVAFGVAHNVGGCALVDTLFPVSCRAWRPLRCSAHRSDLAALEECAPERACASSEYRVGAAALILRACTFVQRFRLRLSAQKGTKGAG